MPTADTSQTTRIKLLSGREFSNYHRLNPYSPQGGRYAFSQIDLVYENLGKIPGNCCTTTIVSSSSGGGGGGGGYIVTYVGNGNTGGTSPTDGSSYTGGLPVTILGNSGTLVKLGTPPSILTNSQFAGWNTEPDGSGINYVGGDTFNITQNTTLYAQWLPPLTGVPLVYNFGTGGSGTPPPSSGTFYDTYSSQPVVGNTGFTNGALVFGGWNTAANGSGTSYPVGSNITMVPNTSYLPITLYAQWINPATTYTLTYSAGTGGSGTAPASPTTYSSKQTATILGNTGPFTNSDPTKIFYGWNTAANGTGISYPVGSSITMNADKTLYAQWGNTPLVTVTYDANGASGGSVPAAPTDYPTGVQVSVLGQGSLTNPGYTFLGWNSSPTGAGSLYAPGYTFSSKTETLYAQWAPGSTLKSCAPTDTQSTSPNTWYDIPYAQVISDSNTITIYLAAYFGTIASNVGTGAGPYGIKSFVSKTVITSTTITINTNTTYTTDASNNNYSQTITNGTGVTYWPSGATISSITFPTTSDGLYVSSEPATFNRATSIVANGCNIGAHPSFFSGGTFTQFYFFNQGVQLNYSNGTNTQFINCPVSALYRNSSSVWSAMPKSNYPYVGVTPTTDNTLTSITIIPSTGSKYVNPPMPDYTVQYDPNGATGPGGFSNPTGLPAPQYMSPYTATTSITISGNTGSLSKTGFTFSGWNTAADGSGTDYAAGATYNGGASLILYAKWV
jgi:uncharacterized repeat protein (TIGR02543 family)